MKIVFWNTKENTGINPYICDIIINNKVDIIILAEYIADIYDLQDILYNYGVCMKQYTSPGCERITLLGNYKNVEPAFQNTYCSLQVIQDSYILGGIHLPSKTHCDRRKRDIAIREIIYEIQKLEDRLSCENTIITGDFNENPYEAGCLAADNFHGIPCCIDAEKKFRQVLGSQFKMFYNPMWNLFGDFSFPPGTFYYNGNDAEIPFWNILDQVMIRPCLRNKFIDNELKILYKAGKRDLVNRKNNRPDKKISDHLPIVFEIKEK